jgi:membrane protease YdiL (CAAX protease family)
MFPAMVATEVFELVYVKTPSPLVVGGVKANAAFPTALVGTEKLLRTVVRALTWKGAVIVFPKKLAVLACVAVIVDVPPPTIEMTSPSIVATAVLELVYVNAPLLFEVGGVMLNEAFPAAFEGNEKSV